MKSNSRHAISAGILAVASVVISVPGCSVATKADTPKLTTEVLRTVDGDTIDVLDQDRRRLRIRIIGIDSPELHKPNYTKACFSEEASEYAHRTLDGQKIALEYDPDGDRIDRYGRTLAYVILADGRNFSVESARGGYAHSYVYGHRPSTHAAEIAAAEQEAKDAGRGLWGSPCYGQTPSVPVDKAGSR
ncbi:thermonuclease family protein [Mycobacteroides abscessus]|uniref:thermonuclease family protein n=1 Tax=Mycobacteroides abscessus TaxID=36809 RepID=UPI0009D0AFA9|nr:thermonuclease family protein [Mycobacteroides abscessus]SKH86916.1 micrococcal nuclease-like nuclease [Mycobacteroides abscessus subsp. massiliense]SKH91432.1 micrococcal nuclease-like nuclease [Mycobacteroides abscessus subsp. massiliense]SKI12323.1 micrococcal nuclease-like nuclease [Mycobacteroides abscessus subsp. massiliense]SKK23395.1 micrococcal nuclease-like nuclease [Mycobacteroides abscessus subsp. massiliense]SKK29804.1 micrococcal nuclease-like nuclease [Mycobacteroides abscess